MRVWACLAALLGLGLSAPAITLTPSVLSTSDSTVTVAWSGVASPTGEDVLRVNGVLASTGMPLESFGWFPVNQSSTWQSGSGSLTFPLVNMRDALFTFSYAQVCLVRALFCFVNYVSCVHFFRRIGSCWTSFCVEVVFLKPYSVCAGQERRCDIPTGCVLVTG